jgi:heptaprenyl diphosphate synthase
VANDAQISLSEHLQLAPLEGDLLRVEELLRQELTGRHRFLDEVTSYLAVAGGKRLRPILTLCGAYAAQRGVAIEPAPDAAVLAATAVEMLHLGSLYHDDVLDEAAVRRSVPSVNARWGNTIAVIGGDILLARAINLAAEIGGAAATLLAGTLEAVCLGQADELLFISDPRRDEASYERATAGKTAALMAASLQIGALTGSLDALELGPIANVGHEFGMAFQVVDDLLDLEESITAAGEAARADIVNGIYTLPVILELGTNVRLKKLLESTPSVADAEEARRLVVSGTGVVVAAERAREHINRSQVELRREDWHPHVEQALTRLGDLILAPISSQQPLEVSQTR